jgi:iron complex transport system ATP-binding protein
LAEPVVSASGLACGYLGRACLSGIDLELRAGSVLALLGPNGSGKSTLLRTLGGLLKPVAGSVLLDGRAIESYSVDERARRIGFVPQDEAPQFAFTVREAVLLGRLPHAETYFDSRHDEEVAQEAMEAAGCAELALRPVTEISGGERQRVWIARALAQEPQVLLMDEPTAHLDVQHALEAASLVRGLAAQGLAVAVAIHDLNLALSFADRAMLLSGGRVLLAGEAQEVLASPELDRAYGVDFERIEAAGRVLLAPRLVR